MWLHLIDSFNYVFSVYLFLEVVIYQIQNGFRDVHNCDLPKYYHNFSRINDRKIWGYFWCFAKLKRSFGEEYDKICNKHFLSVSYDIKRKILNTKKGTGKNLPL